MGGFGSILLVLIKEIGASKEITICNIIINLRWQCGNDMSND